MFVEFQQSVVIVVGDGILVVATFALAGAVLIAILQVALGAARRLI